LILFRGDKLDDEHCTEHDTELNYYCKSCEKPICSDCAMFGDSHKNHEFEKLVNVYNKHLQKIKREKEVQDDKLGELNSLVGNIDKYIEQITSAKEERFKEIDKCVENIHKKLENQMKDKVLDLLTKKERFNEDLCELEECQTEVVNQLEFCSKASLINKSEEIIGYIRNISNQVSSQNSSLDPVSIQFPSEIVPDYE